MNNENTRHYVVRCNGTYASVWTGANRPLSESHVKNLQASLERGYIEHIPVIIHSDGQVVDGQHRLEAAARMGMMLNAVVDNSHSVEASAALPQKTHNLDDMLAYHAECGNEVASRMLDVLRRYKTSGNPLSAAISVQNYGVRLRVAAFTMEDVARADMIFSEMQCYLSPAFQSPCKSQRLVYAHCYVRRINGYSHPVMERQCTSHPAMIVAAHNTSAQIDVLLAVYNYNRRNRLSRSDVANTHATHSRVVQG